jgi:hypothetical protein
MKSRWLGAALIAAGLGVGTVSAQSGFMPTPVGSARIPEPVPVCEPPPQMMPGPLSPYTLPAVNTDCTTLPAGHSSAFQCEEFVRHNECYFSVGAVGLEREKYGRKLMANLDPVNLKNDIASPNATPFIDLHDINQHMQWGVTATAGYICGTEAIEVTALYIFQTNIGSRVAAPGQLDGFFFNPPLGFEGDNGLWLHADVMSNQQRSSLLSGEVNYRMSNIAINDFDLIVGARYIDFKDQLDNFTGDDDLTFPQRNGKPDPRRQALYRTQTLNQMVGAQIGVEYDTMVWTCSWPNVSAGFIAKGAYAVDFNRTEHLLVRGDGFPGFDVRHNTFNPASGIFEAGGFLELHFTERCRLRGGYNVIWLTGVSMAQDQVDFNLRNPQGNEDKHGSVYFAGPTIELQLLF